MAFQTQRIDIDCISESSCIEYDICSKDGGVNIKCLEKACYNGMVCEDIFSLNRTCSGSGSCQTKPPTMSPTSTTTLSPTVETLAPSEVTNNPTNNPTIDPTMAPTNGIHPISDLNINPTVDPTVTLVVDGEVVNGGSRLLFMGDSFVLILIVLTCN